MSRKGNLIAVLPPAVPVLLKNKKEISPPVDLELLKRLKTRAYKELPVYLLQAYDPASKKITYVFPFRTFETLKNILDSLKAENLWPLLSPNPIHISKEFWEEYRQVAYKEPEATVKLVVKYKLLTDEAIHVFNVLTIDIDSPFEDVYPAWKELLSLLELRQGYRVFKTKSSRFRAYISLDGTRDLKRAKELTAIIYAFFESRGLNADGSFVYRLNHPVFYEDFPLYNYKLVESVEGEVPFFELYKRAKRLQKELRLYTFKGKNLTEEFWGKRPPTKKGDKKECRIIKAPAFVRKLEREKLDVFELWKRRVTTLSQKHTSYRYTYVIQPAIGWAKYLELPKDEVTEFLVELLGESKRKDIEKGWKYVRKLEFTVPEKITWWGKTREEWEREVESFIKSRGGEATRQELLKGVFSGQVWLLELILMGMEEAGKIESYFAKHGRGRPRKVYKLVSEVQQVAVGGEDITDFNHTYNSYGAMGGRLERYAQAESKEYTGCIGRSAEIVKVYGESVGGRDGEKGEGRNKESVPNLTAAVKFEIPPELRNLMQEAEQAQKERNLQRLAKMFAKARWYEVELPSLLELYRKDKELCRLLERVLLLSGRRIDDTVRRVSKVLLLQCQREFVERYLKLRPIQPIM